MKFRVCDLFCGAGGFSHGLALNADFKVLLGVDFDKAALQSFALNHANSSTICGDLKDKKIKTKILKECKNLGINMIVGGPPCQGFSNKGKNLGLKDSRNYLFKEFLSIVKALKPEIFVIENVKNLITCANSYFLNEILKFTRNLGYKINYAVLNAADFAVPQNRQRAFLVASKSVEFDFSKLKKQPKVSVRGAISDLAYLDSGEGTEIATYKNAPQSAYQRAMRGKMLYNHKATNHSKIAINKLKMIPPQQGKEFLPTNLHGKQLFKSTWARLVWDEQSPTIDTRFDTPSNGKNSHPTLHRAITPREAARLQSFNDDFRFLGTKTQICKQIGNAVPPRLAKALADEISRQIKEREITLICGDCLKFAAKCEKMGLKFDAIITDPPYNISKKNNFTSLRHKRQGVDFGEWDKEFDPTKWIEIYAKFVSKNGCFVIFCSYLYLSFIIAKLDLMGFETKDILRWEKKNPMPRNVNRRYVNDCEFAIWAVRKGAKWTFNKPKQEPYLKPKFESAIVSGKERLNHPTQKSLNLMQEIIKIHTNEGDLVCDPFCGSGTTGVACATLKRGFVGIELDKSYIEMARARLAKSNYQF